MKIGFIYESSFATSNGSNHLLESTIKRMLSEGHEVYLLQSSFSVNVIDEFPSDFACNRFHYIPIKMRKTNKKKFVRRYINGLKFAHNIKTETMKLDLDMFFVQSSPTASFTIRNIKKKRVPIIYNIHDLFPGSAYKLGILKSRILDEVFKRLQRIGYNLSTKIIVVSKDMKDKLLIEKVDESKIEIVNTWYDPHTIYFVEDAQNKFCKEYDIDSSKLIVQYAGNIGQVFGVKEFSKLVNYLKDNKNIEFHIVGSGAKLDELIEKTRNCNIRFFDWQSQSRLSEVYSYPDFEIIPLNRGVIGNNVPSKMALAMACGKPILNIVEKSYYSDMFESNSLGLSFDQDNIYEMAKILSEYSKVRNNLPFDSEHIKCFNESKYSLNKNINKLMSIINSVIGGKHNDE